MIAIIDYGMGNIGSIANMIRKVGAQPVIVKSPDCLDGVAAIVLPGVGAFDHGMKKLDELGFQDTLDGIVESGQIPILGICLGMQLMTQGSEEGRLPGLGWVQGFCRRFESNPKAKLKVPHMGWNSVTAQKQSRIFHDMVAERRFYFVHSYRLVDAQPSDVATTTVYGEEFVSGFEKGNVLGVQFHPEKSHRHGIQLFRDFVQGLPLCSPLA